MSETVSIKQYIDTRIEEVKGDIKDLANYVTQHFALDDKAAKLASDALLSRLQTMNEFRDQINKERGDYVTKDMQAVESKAIDRRLKDLEMAKSFSAGKMWVVMAIFAAVPTILALIALFK